VSSTWDNTYSGKGPSERSWTEAIPLVSLRLIAEAAVDVRDAIIDVGGGSARLVDELRRRRFADVSVLDVSAIALDEARARLNDPTVTWVLGDVMTWVSTRQYRLWHDRAVFHFLTDPDDQARYAVTAAASVEPNGHVVIGTFSPQGPDTCSGLPVQRWSGLEIAELFAPGFDLETSFEHEHVTPWGSLQPFTWVLLRRHDV